MATNLQIDKSSPVMVINGGIELTAEARCESNKPIIIAGTFIGNIQTNGAVVIEVGGTVRGSISARVIQLNGSIEKSKDNSEVVATEGIAISATGRLSSSRLTYGGMEMDFGSIIEAGSLIPLKGDEKQQTLQQPADVKPSETMPDFSASGIPSVLRAQNQNSGL